MSQQEESSVHIGSSTTTTMSITSTKPKQSGHPINIVVWKQISALPLLLQVSHTMNSNKYFLS